MNTYICIEETLKSPCGSALNKNDESAIAPSKAITHDERNAETLLILAYVLCMVVAVVVGVEDVVKNDGRGTTAGAETKFGND